MIYYYAKERDKQNNSLINNSLVNNNKGNISVHQKINTINALTGN